MTERTNLPEEGNQARLSQLDALRGLAALAVLIGHVVRLSGAWHEWGILRLLDRTPLHLLIAGREAVLLFFTLSGFVLALPYLSGKDRPYSAYLTKRFFRIYVPYLVAVILGFAGYALLARGHIPGMSDWFQTHWHRPPSYRDVANHVGMLGRFRASDYGLTFWSLVHEMRISLVFPLVLIPVLRWRTGPAALFAAGFSVAGIAWAYAGGLKLGDGSVEYAVTVHLIGIFLFGALLAKHREAIVDHLQSLSGAARTSLLVAAAACYIQGRWITDALGENAIAQGLEHWTIAMGAAGAILLLLASVRAGELFTHPSLMFFGRISYSLYLLHGIVLYALVHVLSPHLPIWTILLLVPPAAIWAAAVSARRIEEPAMAMGKRISERLGHRRTTVGPRRLGLAIERSRAEYSIAAAHRSNF